MIEDPRQILKDELRPDEPLLWAGRPQQGVFFRPIDGVFLAWGLGQLGCAISALSQAPLAFHQWVWIVMVVAVGLFLAFGRLMIDHVVRAGLCYGLTDQVLLIRYPFFGKRMKRISLGWLSEFKMEEHRNSRGTILFYETVEPDESRKWRFSDYIGLISTTRIERIENPRSVYAKILEAKKLFQQSQEKGFRQFQGECRAR